jgi:hypothetical protein
MNFKLALGTGVAIVAGYCVLVIGILRKTTLYEHYHRHTGVVISIVGAASLALAWKRRRIAPQSESEDAAPMEEAAESDNGTQHAGFLNARYVGVMSVILGVATVFILPLPPTPTAVPVRAAEPPPRHTAKSVPTNVTPPVVAPVKPVKLVTFPAVRLQGIILDPERPSALISGKTYYIGDLVQDAKVVGITRNYVVLELENEQQAYMLEK